jgi:uncharacterized protein (DUF433 family)
MTTAAAKLSLAFTRRLAGDAHSKLDNRWGLPGRHRVLHCASTSSKDLSIAFDKVLYKSLQGFPLIAMDRDILCGTPRIAGTRVPVYMVLDAVQHYGTLEGALTSYPQLTTEQVKEAVSFAGDVLEQPIEHEP